MNWSRGRRRPNTKFLPSRQTSHRAVGATAQCPETVPAFCQLIKNWFSSLCRGALLWMGVRCVCRELTELSKGHFSAVQSDALSLTQNWICLLPQSVNTLVTRVKKPYHSLYLSDINLWKVFLKRERCSSNCSLFLQNEKKPRGITKLFSFDLGTVITPVVLATSKAKEDLLSSWVQSQSGNILKPHCS